MYQLAGLMPCAQALSPMLFEGSMASVVGGSAAATEVAHVHTSPMIDKVWEKVMVGK